jgi:hypothetical protein
MTGRATRKSRGPPDSGRPQTRRRFGGRQPLWAIGVTSRIDVIWKPDGGQRTQRAFAAGAGALHLDLERLDAMLLRLAARILGGHLRGIGVDLREPLKPIVPADDQEIALPCTSEIRIFVLLKDEFTCATPAAMFFETLRLRDDDRVPCLIPSLISSCRRWASRGPCGCVRWCACADREPAGCGGDAGRDSSPGPSGA